MVVGLAVAAAVLPLPAAAIERWYARGLYPPWQRAATAVSNLLPVALLDIAVALLIAAGLVGAVRMVRRRGWRRAVPAIAWRAAVTAAAVYLAFLACWGLNYRRVPLEAKVVFDAAQITREGLRGQAVASVAALNAGYQPSRQGWDPQRLASAFDAAQAALGATRTARPGRRKWSALGWYFRWAAIDGMTDPFFLEIILNPDVLPLEQPFVIAHEWAHLAGYADESEANFVAFLTCVRGDPAAQYSGWLALYGHLMAALPRDDRQSVGGGLADGPREDLQAIARRLQRSAPVVRRAARDAYDTYLKANRVERGIASYDAVVRLVLGTRFAPGWTPVLADQ